MKCADAELEGMEVDEPNESVDDAAEGTASNESEDNVEDEDEEDEYIPKVC